MAKRAVSTVNEKLRDSALLRAELLDGVTERELRQLERMLRRDVVPALLRDLAVALRGGRVARATRLAAFLASTSQLMFRALKAFGIGVRRLVSRVIGEESTTVLAALKRSAPVSVEFNAVPASLLLRLSKETAIGGKPLELWLQKLSRDAVAAITKHLRVGIALGETEQQIATRLVGDARARQAFGGAMAKVRRDAATVARTAITEASVSAREATYAANADVLKGVQIVATLDSRTTQVCRHYDGKVFPVNEGPRPPFHFNCRTTTAPVTKSWSEIAAEHAASPGSPILAALSQVPLGSRASMAGEVPAQLTYAQWAERRGAGL